LLPLCNRSIGFTQNSHQSCAMPALVIGAFRCQCLSRLVRGLRNQNYVRTKSRKEKSFENYVTDGSKVAMLVMVGSISGTAIALSQRKIRLSKTRTMAALSISTVCVARVQREQIRLMNRNSINFPSPTIRSGLNMLVSAKHVGMIMKLAQLTVLGGLIGGTLLVTAMPANAGFSGRGGNHGALANEIRNDRGAIRQDRQDLRDNRIGLHQDREKLDRDRRDGASRTEIASDRVAIRQERDQIVKERQDLGSERRDMNRAREEEHRSFFDHWDWWR
jgi:energy-converting hydrogenase Eha subunit A